MKHARGQIRLRTVALGAAFALLIAACGSGRSSSDNTTNTTAAGGTHGNDRHRHVAVRSRHRHPGRHRRHDQDRHEPAALRYVLRVQRDPAGRVGVLLVPQRARWRERRRQEVQDPARQQGRRLRRGEDVDERRHADQQRQGLRAVQHRRDEEQPRCPRDGQRRLCSGPPHRVRRGAVGQPEVPVHAGFGARSLPARDADLRQLPQDRTSPTRRSRCSTRTTTSASRTGSRCRTWSRARR